MKLPVLTSAAEVADLVHEIGFLPVFKNEIPGFSVEEHTPDAYWFKEGVEGIWEWRERLAARGDMAYAKVFQGRAGIISAEWYPRFANFRRDGYDFDARCDEGLVPAREKQLYGLIAQGITRADHLRAAYTGKSFESVAVRLQMQGYVIIRGFAYKQNRFGQPYGWGITDYMLPEERFGMAAIEAAYEEDPQESRETILAQMLKICPDIGREAAEKFIK